MLPEREARFWAGVTRASDFFMGTADVQKALVKLARTLEDLHIPYAIAGAMALNELGYERVTSDVDVLLTREGLARLKAAVLGRGYVEKFPNSKGLRDTEHNVPIDVLVAGEFPGDGKPKPIAFPDPGTLPHGETISILPVEKLIELKLASGMTAPHRLKDLADVQELIKHAGLPRDLSLHPWVRAKYVELWDAAQVHDPEEWNRSRASTSSAFWTRSSTSSSWSPRFGALSRARGAGRPRAGRCRAASGGCPRSAPYRRRRPRSSRGRASPCPPTCPLPAAPAPARR